MQAMVASVGRRMADGGLEEAPKADVSDMFTSIYGLVEREHQENVDLTAKLECHISAV